MAPCGPVPRASQSQSARRLLSLDSEIGTRRPRPPTGPCRSTRTRVDVQNSQLSYCVSLLRTSPSVSEAPAVAWTDDVLVVPETGCAAARGSEVAQRVTRCGGRARRCASGHQRRPRWPRRSDAMSWTPDRRRLEARVERDPAPQRRRPPRSRHSRRHPPRSASGVDRRGQLHRGEIALDSRARPRRRPRGRGRQRATSPQQRRRRPPVDALADRRHGGTAGTIRSAATASTGSARARARPCCAPRCRRQEQEERQALPQARRWARGRVPPTSRAPGRGGSRPGSASPGCHSVASCLNAPFRSVSA